LQEERTTPLSVWNIEQDQESGGRVVRTDLPRSSARWMTGADLAGIAALPCLCWSDLGSGEDTIHVYGFEWPRTTCL